MRIINTSEQTFTRKISGVKFGSCFRFLKPPLNAIPSSAMQRDQIEFFAQTPWVLIDNWPVGENRAGFVACVNLENGVLFYVPFETEIIVLEHASVQTGVVV